MVYDLSNRKIRLTDSGCWEWTGFKHRTGHVYVQTAPGNRERVDVLTWLRSGLDLPNGMTVGHHCGNRACVRVDHLFLYPKPTAAHAAGVRRRGSLGGIPLSEAHPRIRLTLSGCWEWLGARAADGYGQLYARKNLSRLAHRRAWQEANGEIPAGMYVCHRCDNPPCCNPAHLFLGTPRDNFTDATKKGRIPRSPRGPLTELKIAVYRERQLTGASYVTLGKKFGIPWGSARSIVNSKRARESVK